jgi:thymidylate kinase
MKGKFIIIDGIDGSGKGIIIQALKEYYERFFDLKEYTKEHKQYPKIEEIKHDIIFSSEPTYLYAGAAIRDELLKGINKYSG